MSTWKSFKILDSDITFKVVYGGKLRRLDIRGSINGYSTKYGISLTASEFNYVYNYYLNYNDFPQKVNYYNLVLTKKCDDSFIITKNKDFCTPLEFWDKICPYIPAALYLLGQEIAVDQLIDLFILSYYTNKDDMFNRKWEKVTCVYIEPDGAIPYELGLANSDAFNDRKLNIEALEQFAGSNPEVFRSFLAIMYK